MDIGTIDFWANNWDSYLHRASALSKLLGVALIIAAVVVTLDLPVLITVYLAIAAAIVGTRLPAIKILTIAAYPAIFAILFAVSRWDGTFVTPATIILKALSAALAMLMLITTTPYPDVFASFRRLLPGPVGDGLFLTYRSLFILLELSGDLWTALRLRGGLSRRRYWRNAANIASGLALLLLHALAFSERLYDVMRIRGYRGYLAVEERWRRASRYDIFPLSLGVSLLALSLAARFYREAIGPYNGYFPLLAMAGLLSAIIYASRRGVTRRSL